MTLSVLKSNNERGEEEMMKLIRYTIAESGGAGAGDDIGSLTNGGM